jgi:hypothetical protein
MKSMWKRSRDREAKAIAYLEQVSTPAPSPRLVHHGLQHVLAKVELEEASLLKKRRSYRLPSLTYRFALVLLLIPLLLFFSSVGVYAMSYDAQPDSSLYGTKIFFERARLTLALSATHDLRLEMEFSERRIGELEKMIASGKNAGADRWLGEYLRNLERADSLLTEVPQQEVEALSRQLLLTVERQAAYMESLRHGAPSALEPQIEKAYDACSQERERMRKRCGVEESRSSNPSSPDQSSDKESKNGGGSEQDDERGSHEKPLQDPDRDKEKGIDSGLDLMHCQAHDHGCHGDVCAGKP